MQCIGILAKNEYDTELGVYDDAIYAKARLKFLAQNFPALLEPSQGVLRAFGLPTDNVVHDVTSLTNDL